MNTTFRQLLSAAFIVALTGAGMLQTANAQNAFHTAGEKISGGAYWPAHATARHLQSAQSYAQDFQAHVARVGKPEAAVAAEVHKTLTGYLDEANKHLASMKKDFAGDKETVAAVEKMEKDLAAAVAQNQSMLECCKEEKFDKAMAMTCCTDLAKQLGKVHEDHIALMKKLSQKHAK